MPDERPLAARKPPSNKLTDEEKETIVSVCNSPENASLPPSQIVPKLADEGVYIASESSFYRVLRERSQIQHRGSSRQREKRSAPDCHRATGANQVWSWDITYCASKVRGQYYYLYMIEDVYSRKIVGFEVHESETGELAAELLQRTVWREQCSRTPPVLHSDNGAPMKSVTMKAKMEALGIAGSHSRPRVSNDNPFSESLFKTMKYGPTWPVDGFESLAATRDWVNDFVLWYNESHRHSGIEFVTPAQRHRGEDQELLINRRKVYEAARQKNPSRWSGNIRKWEWKNVVELNPGKSPKKQEVKQAA